jgi:hypothetical protein
MRTFTMRHHLPSILICLAFGLYALGFSDFATAAPAIPPADQSDITSRGQLPEVMVNGKMDSHTLDRAINQFVQSHAKPSTLIGQVGRWREKVCPAVTGLQSAAAEFVSHQIESVARGVGAPTPVSDKKCSVNIEVAFTSEPQALLDHIATQ